MSDTPRTDLFCRTVNYTTIIDGKVYQATIETVDASFARQLETELADKDKQLAEAHAEIERLKDEHENSLDGAKNYTLKLSDTVTKQAGELFAKDALIEQMREALALILEGAIHDFHYVCQHRGNCLCWGCQKKRVKAALEAAERASKHEIPKKASCN